MGDAGAHGIRKELTCHTLPPERDRHFFLLARLTALRVAFLEAGALM